MRREEMGASSTSDSEDESNTPVEVSVGSLVAGALRFLPPSVLILGARTNGLEQYHSLSSAAEVGIEVRVSNMESKFPARLDGSGGDSAPGAVKVLMRELHLRKSFVSQISSSHQRDSGHSR